MKGRRIVPEDVTLCRYEEFYKDEKILKLIDRLAQKLASMKTLEYEGRIL